MPNKKVPKRRLNVGRTNKEKIIQALDSLERNVLSLNYEGYFTRNLFGELKSVLDLWVSFRVHLTSQDDRKKKIHCYGQLEEDVIDLKEEFDKNVNKIRGEYLESLESLNKDKIWETKLSKINTEVKNNYGEENVLRTIIDIPLLVKKCRKCKAPFFLQYSADRCANKDCTESPEFEFVLPGIIRFYSSKEFSSSPISEEEVKRICEIYSLQKEPDCFPKGSENTSFCKFCRFQIQCAAFVNGNGKDKDLLDPDEVIHQLHTKCRMIMGPTYQFPTLLYNTTRRLLLYRAVDYITLPDPEQVKQSMVKEDWTKIETDLNNFKNFVKDDFEKIRGEYQILAKKLKNNAFTNNELINPARELLKNVIQRTYTGTTRYVWNAWEGINLSHKKLQSASSSKEEPSGEVLRKFVERLFFTGTYNGIIVMPLGYLGQKLGVMFINVDKRDAESESDFDKRLKKDSFTFSRIALEFSPLLFHSLIYEIYAIALSDLEKKEINEIPNILLSRMPKALNIVAGAFWSERQIMDPKQNGSQCQAPKYLHAFEGFGEDYYLKEIDKGKIDEIWKKEFCNPSFQDVSKAWYENQSKVDDFYPNGSNVYKKDGINIRSRFLLPIRNEKFKGEPYSEEIQGVFDLYFDLSRYIINRHKTDLFRELSFLFVQTANAAHQKHKVIQHGLNAAVAAIMARNFDHNLGGHLLSYLTNLYDEWAKEKISKEEIDKKKNGGKELTELETVFSIFTDDKIMEPLQWFLKNNSYLLKYLKDRMDFIATILTFIPSPSTLNIPNELIGQKSKAPELDALISDLNYDISFIDNRQEIAIPGEEFGNLKYFTPRNFLLNYLAFSEKLEGANISRERIIIRPNIKNEVLAAIPGGSVGKQAFYSILENLARNAAKHKPEKVEAQQLEFVIEFPDENSSSKDTNTYNKDDLLRVTITDNLKNGQIAEMLQTKCKMPIVNNDGSFEKTDLGLKEMKICAAFLRGYGPGFIKGNELRNWPNDSAKEILNFQNIEGNLQCSFFLLKPKEILILTDNLERWGRERRIKNLLKKGIDFVILSGEGNKENMMSLDDLEERYKMFKLRHRFILLDCENDILKDLDQTFLPLRKIERVREFWKKFGPEKFIECVYLDWLKKLSNENFSGLLLPDLVIHLPGKEKEINSRWGNDVRLYEKWDSEQRNFKNPSCIYFTHFEDKVKEFCKDKELDLTMKCKNVIHVESITGANSSRRKIEDPRNAALMRLELMEAGLTKILIIDERIFNMQRRKNNSGAFLRAKGIEVWDFNEDNGLFYSLISNEKYEEVNINGYIIKLPLISKNLDFVVIHQGIIDKLLKAAKLSKEYKNIKMTLEIFNNKTKFKAIHSGRGKTEDIPEDWRFLTYSELESWFFDDKHTLIQGLYSLRGR
jgi:hypothetical protein